MKQNIRSEQTKQNKQHPYRNLYYYYYFIVFVYKHSVFRYYKNNWLIRFAEAKACVPVATER